MVYQINSSKLFLTYPQCPLDKDYVRTFLQGKFNPTEIIVAHERHANGDDHLHAYLALPETLRVRDPKFADIDGYHGNYQGCRSSKSVIKYCTKDEDYTGNVDVSSLLAKRSNRREVIGQLLLGKRTLVQIVDDHPEYLLGYTRIKLDYNNYLKDKSDTRLSLPPFLPNPWGLVLPTKVLSKRRHYWLYSDKPNVGKTYHFAKPIGAEYTCHIRTGDEPYWDLRGDESLVILDEYNAAIFKYHQLNGMADGNYAYRIFMGGVVRLPSPIICILSNVSIRDLYPNKYDLLYARFKEIKLD